MRVQLGKNIKSLRQSKSWSQEIIAEKLGITPPAFSKIENGITDLNFSRLCQIAGLFEKSPVELILFHDYAQEQAHRDEVLALRDQLAQKDADLIRLQSKVIRLLEAV